MKLTVTGRPGLPVLMPAKVADASPPAAVTVLPSIRDRSIVA
jgi:hypothetical protein